MDKYKLSISGRNVKYILDRIIKLNISLLNIEYIDNNNLNILIYKEDYKKIKNIKTTYKIKIIKKYGIIHLKEILNMNKILIIITIIGLVFLKILSSLIFNIEVIHKDSYIRNIIYKELDKNNIKKYKFKKKQIVLNKIKKDILNKYKNNIEWLEIETKGTTYIVRVKERKIDKKEELGKPRHIIAKKNAVIKSIKGVKGVLVKERDNYVNKGDIIISGEIKLNEEVKSLVEAQGIVYGEVWHKAVIEYPYYLKEVKEKSTSKYLVFNYFNKKKILFKKVNNYKVLKTKKSIIPIYFSIEEIQKLEIKEDINTCDTASIKALQVLKNNKEEEILDVKVLNKECQLDKVQLEVFYTALENITDYQIID